MQSKQRKPTGATAPSLRPTMYSDIDESEWRWEQILTRPIHPDDAPTIDEDEELEDDDH